MDLSSAKSMVCTCRIRSEFRTARYPGSRRRNSGSGNEIPQGAIRPGRRTKTKPEKSSYLSSSRSPARDIDKNENQKKPKSVIEPSTRLFLIGVYPCSSVAPFPCPGTRTHSTHLPDH